MPIGRDLLDLPFAEMVRNLGLAIAEGQTALDRNSLETLQTLVNTNVDVVTDIVEVIEPDDRDVLVDVPDGAGGTTQETIRVSGARVRASGAPPITMNMFQAGLSPTFYQFTEAALEVKLSITMREDRQSQTLQRATSGGAPAAPGGSLSLGMSRAYASSVDYRSANKYSYQATGASVLRATMKPVPAPTRLEPAVISVNTLTQPPTVTRMPA